MCGCISVMTFSIASCEDYLEKDPDSTVSAEDAFMNFNHFQGFIEEIYNCIPNKMECYWTTSFNWGDDEVMNPNASWHVGPQFDNGNFWAWQSGNTSQDGAWLDGQVGEGPSYYNNRLWSKAWFCIRKANLGLKNLPLMVDATEEERNLIAGQLYFFRAWWHFELSCYLGGLPYVDKVLESNDVKLPRLSFQECADKAAADFRKAADLLPIDWDKTTAGKNTYGKNQLRINKIMALGYLGKAYLWAASPLMKNGAQLGGAKTYDYDTEYAKKSAEAFGELLSLVEDGKTQYALAEFDYSDIYNHTKSPSAKTCYSEIFYTMGQNFKMPGTCEAIFRGPTGNGHASSWNAAKTWGPKAVVEHDNIIHQPTANYVNLYGMSNGYRLDDSKGYFDKTHPFQDRDPRFYHDIVFDGFKYVNAKITNEDKKKYQYSELFTGGNVRVVDNASRTGYFTQKLVPHTCNEFDDGYEYAAGLQVYLPYMRLADIYLMYAEACAAIDGAKGKSSNFNKTAEDAINTLRDRVKMSHVPSEYTANKNTFMDEVRRERAVELAFEGFRFCDLQRWLLLTEEPYTVKTSQEFDRVYDQTWYESHDPRNAEVKNWREETIIKREFGTKHYWLPLKVEDTYLYEGFKQNPGW